MLYKQIAKFIKNHQVNPVIRALILSDFIVLSANQLFAPIFAIFVVNNLEGGNIKVVGFAASIYLFSKSILEIPIGLIIDKYDGESDDLYSTFAGVILSGIAIFLFNYITTVKQLYLLQIFLGISAAITIPGWYSIFTKHIDRGKAAFEWSLHDVLLAMGMALAAFVGGIIAQRFGFSVIFTLAAIGNILGAFLLLIIRKKME